MKNSKSKTKFYKIQAKQLKIQIIINNNNNNKELKQEKENGKFFPMLLKIFFKWIDNLKK